MDGIKDIAYAPALEVCGLRFLGDLLFCFSFFRSGMTFFLVGFWGSGFLFFLGKGVVGWLGLLNMGVSKRGRWMLEIIYIWYRLDGETNRKISGSSAAVSQ